jgi:hypothetical protein
MLNRGGANAGSAILRLFRHGPITSHSGLGLHPYSRFCDSRSGLARFVSGPHYVDLSGLLADTGEKPPSGGFQVATRGSGRVLTSQCGSRGS